MNASIFMDCDVYAKYPCMLKYCPYLFSAQRTQTFQDIELNKVEIQVVYMKIIQSQT